MISFLDNWYIFSLLTILIRGVDSFLNPGGLAVVLFEGNNLPPLVWLGLTDLPNSVEALTPGPSSSYTFAYEVDTTELAWNDNLLPSQNIWTLQLLSNLENFTQVALAFEYSNPAGTEEISIFCMGHGA